MNMVKKSNIMIADRKYIGWKNRKKAYCYGKEY